MVSLNIGRSPRGISSVCNSQKDYQDYWITDIGLTKQKSFKKLWIPIIANTIQWGLGFFKFDTSMLHLQRFWGEPRTLHDCTLIFWPWIPPVVMQQLMEKSFVIHITLMTCELFHPNMNALFLFLIHSYTVFKQIIYCQHDEIEFDHSGKSLAWLFAHSCQPWVAKKECWW